jgi:general secretion pathway protein D
MSLIRVSRMAILALAMAVALPARAQQPPVTPTPAPSPNQPSPSTQQSPVPGDPNVPPGPRPPVLPRRIPAPVQVPPGQAPAPAAVPGPLPTPLPPNQAPPVSGDSSAPAPQPVPAIPVPSARRGIPGQSIPAGGMVSLNFNRADLVEIIHIIAQQLRLTYTIDPEVKGTVTINSAEPLRSEDLMPIFHQLLRMNGAVAVRTGNLYHIMPIKDGKGLARPLAQGREDSFALQLIPVRFFTVAEMKRVLTPFLQPGAEIVDNPRGNFLIVMDTPLNIQRLVEIADLIDVQVFAGTRMEIYQPRIASAEELSQEMTKVMQSFSASSPQSENFAAQFIPLPRINQLLVIAHSEAAWTYAKRWLDRIDVVAEGPGRRIFIYPVENGKATELADVLSQALGLPSTGSKVSTQTLQSIHRSSSSSSNQSGNYGQSSGSSQFGSGQFGSGSMQQGQTR